MAAMNAELVPSMGKLVSMEGDSDIISTQLRLLPPSQKILLLPSLLDDLTTDAENLSFEPRTFVREVHRAFIKRTESARTFLKSSTTSQPRLVFMNGGSVRARATCISRISERVTDGDIADAEALFNEIVKDGVAGLMQDVEFDSEATPTETELEHAHLVITQDKEEDPTLKAMKAADSLDRETAALQSENSEGDAAKQPHGIDQSGDEETREQQLIVPETELNEVVTPTQERAEHNLFNASIGDEVVRTIVTVPSRKDLSLREKRTTFGHGHQPDLPITPVTSRTYYSEAHSHQSEDIDDESDWDADILSPGAESFISNPPTPMVVYGEACVIDMQSAVVPQDLRRVRSVDSFFPSSSHELKPESPKLLRHATSANHLGRWPTATGSLDPHGMEAFQKTPRSTFLQASQTMIRKLQSRASYTSPTRDEATRVYMDRGTDAEAFTEDNTKPFEPVFPIVEDLIIEFTNDVHNEVFETVIQSYKNGSYPILPDLPDSRDEIVSPVPVGTNENGVANVDPESHLTPETQNVRREGRDSYDPYAAHDPHPPAITRPWSKQNNSGQTGNTSIPLESPTPLITPPPEHISAEKFLKFNTAHSNNAINIQNSLRQILNARFPAGENGYSQYVYSPSPEADRLWKPVFRNDDSAPIGNEGRNLDHILALGCENGVKKDFFAQVSGQVEKLGIKKDGVSRSGKLDIRYLIATIMQNVPLDLQNYVDPLSNPHILATLLVPQLEAFLATNTSIRFLILHYTSDHLATVLALRKLLGTDIIKVAGLLDALSLDPASRPRTPPKTLNPLSNDALNARSHSRLGSVRTLQRQVSTTDSVISSITAKAPESIKPSFSKANYLLPSIATDAEITGFLTGIWKSLMEKSSFYTPEPEPKPVVIEKPPTPKTPSSLYQRDQDQLFRDSAYPPSSFRSPRSPTERESKISRLTGQPPPQGHKYAASITSTVRTTATERGRREDREWENFYIADEDSDDDEYDRMILGRNFAKILPEVRKPGTKRPTKKALKWLGLA